MGTQQTPINVVFDTGSDWLLIPESNCTNCNGPTFNATNSGTPVNTTLSERDYTSVTFEGATYKDKVCLDKT